MIIFSQSLLQHLEHIKAVFDKLISAGLKCHPGKCTFAVDKVSYLGHMVTPGTLGPQMAKVAAVTNMLQHVYKLLSVQAHKA